MSSIRSVCVISTIVLLQPIKRRSFRIPVSSQDWDRYVIRERHLLLYFYRKDTDSQQGYFWKPDRLTNCQGIDRFYEIFEVF